MPYNDYICAKSGRHFRNIDDWKICATKRNCANLSECPIAPQVSYKNKKARTMRSVPLNSTEMARLEAAKAKYQRGSDVNVKERSSSKIGSFSPVGLFMGIMLVFVGIILLLMRLGSLSGSIFSYILPVGLFVLGAIIVFSGRHR